ncbi:MAG: heavy metal translocating P-type ATPase [Gammaproteobacteria bacterium]|nr:heavy metal translocating P-type ATPase [Gammaproteobacteria bacterium]
MQEHGSPESTGHDQSTQLDPVCGMTVSPATSAASTEYQARTYHFCSQGCESRFSADPYFYLSGAHKRQASLVIPDATYICPMDPEIEEDEPGPCPICGMALEPSSGVAEGANPELIDFQRRLLVSVVCALPLLLVAMGPMLGLPLGNFIDQRFGHSAQLWLQWLLATPVVLWAAWPFFARGWQSVVSSNYNMWTLIMLGVGVAYGYSTLALLLPGLIPESLRHGGTIPVYFESAVVIVVLIFVGQVLELRAREKTTDAVRALLQLAPDIARRLNADGTEYDAPVANLLVGDKIRVRPGEQIAVDGIVLEGHSSVDESLVTGEPVPVEKTQSAVLTAGTINRTGSMVMQATRVGQDTMLSRIIEMVSNAQRSRAPVQQMADKVAAVFVPVVVVIAVLAFVAWWVFGPAPALVFALLAAISVLVIACPCALGLATPMSIMTAVGRGAREGVLVRDASVFESLARADTLIVDKTGTLTAGRPQLTEIVTLAHPATNGQSGSSEDQLLALVAALEVASEHPLAGAILEAAEARKLPRTEVHAFTALTGQGLTGEVGNLKVAVGNRALMQQTGTSTVETDSIASELEQRGHTVLFVSIDSQAAGLIALADVVRIDAAKTLDELQSLGYSVVMATGDNELTARALASQLNIQEVHSGLMPADKKDLVEQLKAQGRHVVMLGDGINDAPALAAAGTGIAMGTGADVAIESAGITLLRGDLPAVVTAIRLARATVRNIKQNLFFAFFYNAAGIPVAAGVLYPWTGWLLSPMIAAAAMSLSSVSVISNALRLRTARLR